MRPEAKGSIVAAKDDDVLADYAYRSEHWTNKQNRRECSNTWRRGTQSHSISDIRAYSSQARRRLSHSPGPAILDGASLPTALTIAEAVE